MSLCHSKGAKSIASVGVATIMTLPEMYEFWLIAADAHPDSPNGATYLLV